MRWNRRVPPFRVLTLAFAAMLLGMALPDLSRALVWVGPGPGSAPETGYRISIHDPHVLSVANGLLPGGGVAVSRDGGVSFMPVPGDVHPEGWTWDLHTVGLVWGRVDDSLWRSMDDGRTWTAVSWPYAGQYPTPLQAPHQGAPLYVYAEHAEGWCIHKSNDSGESWFTMHQNDGNVMKTLRSVRVVRTPAEQTWIYALAPIKPNPNGEPTHVSVVRSTLGGMNWNLMQPDPDGQTPYFGDDLTVHPEAPNRLHVSGRLDNDPAGRMFPLVSTNGGAAWAKVEGPWGEGEASVHPRLDGSLVAFSRDGVYLSDDYGQTWTVEHTSAAWPPGQFAGIAPSRVRFNGQDINHLWIPYEGMLLRSSDGGLTWDLNTSGLRGDALRRLQVVHPHVALASHDAVAVRLLDGGTSGELLGARPGLQVRLGYGEQGAAARWTGLPDVAPGLEVRQGDDGAWIPRSLPFGATTIHDLAWHPSQPDELLLLASVAGGGAGLWRSVNAGESWSARLATVAGPARLTVPGGDRVLLMRADSLLASADGGLSFTAHPMPLGTDGLKVSADGSTLLRYDLGGGGSAALSDDDGATWTALDVFSDHPLQAPPAPGPGGQVHFVADDALWRLSPTTDELELIDPVDSEAVFDVTVASDGSVYLATWEGVRAGLNPAGVGKGRRHIRSDAASPDQFMLHPVYPNPFNASATVALSLPAAGELRVDVLNLLGQRVLTLADGPSAAGTLQLTLPGQSLASGSYLLRARLAGQPALTRRLTVVK